MPMKACALAVSTVPCRGARISWPEAYHASPILAHGALRNPKPTSRRKRENKCLFAALRCQMPPPSPTGNLNNLRGAEADKVFDELVKKYEKALFSSAGDRRTPTTEAIDDAESLSLAVKLARVASDVKAADIRVLYVKPLVHWTRFFIIATAFSNPQIDAIGSRVRDMAEKQFGKVANGDTKANAWTLLDFGDVVVHIFLPQTRVFYNLEEFYGNATPIDLPFDSQPSFRN